jgi:hypothetical protein
VFDKLLRELKRLERGVQVPIQIPLDEDGQFDRRCPSEICQAEFKVLFDDWKEKVRDEAAYCPICRHEAKGTDWNTPAQQEYIRKAALSHLQGVVQKALHEDSRRFNFQQPRGGFISLSLSYRPGSPIIAIPPDAADRLRQHFVCEACSCRYSSLGAAFFCPACGHNSAASTFVQAVEGVRASVGSLDAIRDAVRSGAGEDAAMDTSRQILENGLVKLVASFQRLAEATFQSLPNASTIRVRKNLFQNLTEASTVWRTATGKGYEDLLSATELAAVSVFFQQRHLLAHREGLVDQDYIDKAQDLTYKIGQKLIIKDVAVLRLAELVERLAIELKALVAAASVIPPTAPPS